MNPYAAVPTGAALLAAALAACAPAGGRVATGAGPAADSGAARPITDARSLVARMRGRYDGRWYRTLSVLQKNTRYRPGGGETQSQWRQLIGAPGRMRIDYLPLENQDGVLYRGDSVYAFIRGKQVQAQRTRNLRLVLGVDAYTQPVDTTLARLAALGFDLGRFHVASWRGRRVLVVGAAPGDTTSDQFWVDADRLALARLIQRQRRSADTVVTDLQVSRYAEQEGLPIAAEVLLLHDGRPVFREELTEARLNVELPDGTFDPARWGESEG